MDETTSGSDSVSGEIVVVTSLNGDRIYVEVVVQAQPTTIVNQLDGDADKQDRVVE